MFQYHHIVRRNITNYTVDACTNDGTARLILSHCVAIYSRIASRLEYRQLQDNCNYEAHFIFFIIALCPQNALLLTALCYAALIIPTDFACANSSSAMACPEPAKLFSATTTLALRDGARDEGSCSMAFHKLHPNPALVIFPNPALVN